MTAAAAPRDRRSLFGEILDWMLAPLLLLWPLSVVLTWLVAQNVANLPYDRELGQQARRVAAAARTGAAPEQLQRALAEAVAALGRAADDDVLHVQLAGRGGELLAGEPDLAPPAEPAPGAEPRYRDDVVRGQPVRVAALWLGDENGALLQLAETLGKRSRLATEITKGVILPQLVFLPLAVLLVWLALARGIRPLAELSARIRRRDSTDLSPIDDRRVPDEVASLVDAINDLLARLDQSIAAQRHFLADAAHQLKTPLAGLRTQAELAVREVDGGRPAQVRHALEQIALSSQRAAHMVNQLLAMARAEDKEQALRREPTDLAAITAEAVRDFVPRALDQQLDLGYEGPAAGIACFGGRPVLVRELVRNLVDNALQYTPAGGTVTARVMPDPFGQVVVLQVEDSGPGIAAGERELVLQPFYRALGTAADGSGLGLAIVAEIAKVHDAEVAIGDAQARGGALITVRFPLRPADG